MLNSVHAQVVLGLGSWRPSPVSTLVMSFPQAIYSRRFGLVEKRLNGIAESKGDGKAAAALVAAFLPSGTPSTKIGPMIVHGCDVPSLKDPPAGV